VDAEDWTRRVQRNAMGGAAHFAEPVMPAQAEDEEISAAGGDFCKQAFNFATIHQRRLGLHAGVGSMLNG
jgi:hypothetical protein